MFSFCFCFFVVVAGFWLVDDKSVGLTVCLLNCGFGVGCGVWPRLNKQILGRDSCLQM